MTEQNQSQYNGEGLNIHINGISFSAQVSMQTPSLKELYKDNPQRCELYLNQAITSAMGSILSGEGLDTKLSKIFQEAELKKMEVIKIAQRAEGDSQN